MKENHPLRVLNTSIAIDCLSKIAKKFSRMLNTFDHEHFWSEIWTYKS